MSGHTFTDAEELTLVSALRIAAERYDQHAANLRAYITPETAPAFERLALQFDQQAGDACALADRIENADPDELTDEDRDDAAHQAPPWTRGPFSLPDPNEPEPDLGDL